MSGSGHVYHELTVWSRGIIMDKEARDVSSCIAAAARALGYYADNVSDYVDDPDRTNCLVRRYARFGDSPIVALTAVPGDLPGDAVADRVPDADAMRRGATKPAGGDFPAGGGGQEGQFPPAPAPHATTAD